MGWYYQQTDMSAIPPLWGRAQFCMTKGTRRVSYRDVANKKKAQTISDLSLCFVWLLELGSNQ
jgi:hypothetical protein